MSGFLLLSNADIAFWDSNEDKKYWGSRPTRAETDDDLPLQIHALKHRYKYLRLYRDSMGNPGRFYTSGAGCSSQRKDECIGDEENCKISCCILDRRIRHKELSTL
jgi:hypothetical protein